MAAAFALLGAVQIPADASDFVSAAYPVIGGIIGAVVGLGIIYQIMLITAPYKQRNEARELVEQQRKPSDREVTDAIRLLEAEKLVFKNNEEEERSYSFSQVFLALADQLSTGISSIQFEDKISKGLNIDERGGWYFPYKDEGITHLIGMLDQNGLVERRNEEYQRMVSDYPLDLTEAIMKARNTFRPKPPQHLEKGTEVKYYISPLGSRVVLKLRQQLTSHKEGSQNE